MAEEPTPTPTLELVGPCGHLHYVRDQSLLISQTPGMTSSNLRHMIGAFDGNGHRSAQTYQSLPTFLFRPPFT